MRIISELYPNRVAILLLIGLILPSFSLGQQSIAPPETLGEAKEMEEKSLEVTKKELPGVLEKIWREEVLPTFQKIGDWLRKNIWSKIENWFKKEIEPPIKEEIEKRKPIVQEEFRKGKEKLSKISQSFWKRFKELMK